MTLVEIKPEWDESSKTKPRVIKDGKEYEVVQLHYHWGTSDDSGSEHIFNDFTLVVNLLLLIIQCTR